MNIASLVDTGKVKALEIVQSGKAFECSECEHPIMPIMAASHFGDFHVIAKINGEFGIEHWRLDAPGHEQCIEQSKIKAREEEEAKKQIAEQKKIDDAYRAFVGSIPHENADTISLESFALDDDNREAYELTKAYGEDDFGLLFSGPSGTGKSHLMIALAKEMSAAGCDCLFIQAARFYDECGRNEFRIPNEYLRAYYLFLDDLGTENLNDMKREWLFNLLESRKNSKRITFISTNLSPKDLREKFFERIASRIFELTVPIIVGGVDRRLEKLKDRMAQYKARIKK